MTWGASKQAGFALAAVLNGDRALAQLEAHLDRAVFETLRGLLSAIPGAPPDAPHEAPDAPHEAPPDAKARALHMLATQVRPALDTELRDLPALARAHLARHVPRELGRKLLGGAPALRHDAELLPDLEAALLRIARAVSAREAK